MIVGVRDDVHDALRPSLLIVKLTVMSSVVLPLSEEVGSLENETLTLEVAVGVEEFVGEADAVALKDAEDSLVKLLDFVKETS